MTGLGAYALLAAVAAVFVHSATRGENGLDALAAERAEARALEATLSVLEAERAALANRVGRLSGEGIDPDLLDERARAVLGYARDDELLIRP
ncbi:MAG: septum formation initiator family protein [Pseudomonadota bacterium]